MKKNSNSYQRMLIYLLVLLLMSTNIVLTVKGDVPTVTTNDATGVEETNALLNGYLSNDGEKGCYIGFEYGTTTSYGTSVTDSIWDNHISLSDMGNLRSGGTGPQRQAVKKYNFNGVILSVSWYLHSVNQPVPGTVYCRLRYCSNSTIIATSSDSYLSSTIGGSWAWYKFNFLDVFITNTDIYVSAETDGGNDDHFIKIGYGGEEGWLYFLPLGPEWIQYNTRMIKYNYGELRDSPYTFSIGTTTSLSQGTLYHYRAFAKNTDGTSYGSDKTFLTKPDDITDVTASPSSFSQINLTWSNGAGGVGSYIEYATSSPPSPWNPGSGIKIDADGYVSGTSYQHTSLNSRTHYYYKAWAYAEDDGVRSNGQDIYPFGNSQNTDTTTLGPNHPPNTPKNPNPEDHATGIDINADLSWIGGDPDAVDTVTYDVYFGAETPPPRVSTQQLSTKYDPGTMNTTKKYFWKIVAQDNHGNNTNGPIWDFTTIDELVADAGGPYLGTVDQLLQFLGNASGGISPYEYHWDFGDGNTSIQQNPLHMYGTTGTYTITFTITDSVNHSVYDTTFVEIFSGGRPVIETIHGGFGISAEVKNIGNSECINISWSVAVSGGFIFSENFTQGRIEKLAVDETETIQASRLRGIGFITITVQVGEESKQASGFLLGPLVLRVTQH